jgi:hypothetical protein
MRAAQELLGALTIGGGSARPGGGSGGSHRSQISLPSHPECMKTAQKRLFSPTYWFKNAVNTVFYLKVLNKMYSQDVFWGIHNFLKKFLLKALWSYTFSNFRKSYMPPAARISFKETEAPDFRPAFFFHQKYLPEPPIHTLKSLTPFYIMFWE